MFINAIIRCIRNFHSFRFNLKVFDFKTAIKLPVLISRKVKCFGLYKGGIRLTAEASFGMVKLGVVEGSQGIWKYDDCEGIIDISGNGAIEFGGNINISKGFTLKAINGAELKLGSNIYANPYLTVLAKKSISIGNDCLFGWHITLNDGDGHSVVSLSTNEKINSDKAVVIGNHVWIGAEASILKGSYIPNDCVVGYRTLVGKKFDTEHSCIVGEYPGRISLTGISWNN